MTEKDKPGIFWGTTIKRWCWHCPGGGTCKAETHECFGSSDVWEVAMLAAMEHVREHHRQPVSHDAPTPPNGQPRVEWEGRYRIAFDDRPISFLKGEE